jgi:hypothetical protein
MSKSVDIVDATVAIEIMRLVVEAEGLAVPNAAKLDDEKEEEEMMLEVSETQQHDSGQGVSNLPTGISRSKFVVFQRRFPDLMFHRDSIPMDELSSAASSWLEDGSFSRTDVENILSHMQKINKLLVADGEVHLI